MSFISDLAKRAAQETGKPDKTKVPRQHNRQMPYRYGRRMAKKKENTDAVEPAGLGSR